MRWRELVVVLTIIMTIVLFGWTRSPVQSPPARRLSCEEITGGLYIANAQLAEQIRDTAEKLREAQMELEKAKK